MARQKVSMLIHLGLVCGLTGSVGCSTVTTPAKLELAKRSGTLGSKSDTMTTAAKSSIPAPEEVAQVVTSWNNQVVYAPDPFRGGALHPGLVCRMFLFGPQIDKPRVGDGSLTVDLYDATPRGPNSEPVHLERWEINPETLRQFLKQDIFGWGYTLVLPWGTYRPEITTVNLITRYHPKTGKELLAPTTSLTIDHSATLERVRASQNTQIAQATGQPPHSTLTPPESDKKPAPETTVTLTSAQEPKPQVPNVPPVHELKPQVSTVKPPAQVSETPAPELDPVGFSMPGTEVSTLRKVAPPTDR